MLLQQYDLGGVVPASYRIVDEATGTAVAVDPRWDVEGANRAGLRPILFSRDRDHFSDCVTIDRLDTLLEIIRHDAEVG